MEGGYVRDVFVNMMGGVGEDIIMVDYINLGEKKEKLFKIFKFFIKDGFFISVFILVRKKYLFFFNIKIFVVGFY